MNLTHYRTRTRSSRVYLTILSGSNKKVLLRSLESRGGTVTDLQLLHPTITIKHVDYVQTLISSDNVIERAGKKWLKSQTLGMNERVC